jgi:galactokinase
MSTPGQLRSAFCRLYGAQPRVYRAPGRINLIGEHTDYNEGFVLPAALAMYAWIAAAPRADRRLRLHSLNFGEDAGMDLNAPPRGARKHWSDYAWGVAVALEQAGHRLQGADLMVLGEVPLGAGLASSAAFEVAVALALAAISGHGLSRLELARLCQRAENEFVGARCGIMDQFVACHGQAGNALLLDCRSLEFTAAPLPAGVTLVACNTMVKHALTGGEYNTRRAECEEGVATMARSKPGLRSLRDITVEQLEAHRRELPDRIYRRCRHVVTENARTLQAAKCLGDGDLAALPRLMAESHASLRDDYAVSCRELDLLVEIAGQQPGLLGARMTGGGFGGCTVNLVRAEQVEEFRHCVAREYERRTNRAPEIYISTAAGGAGEVLSAPEG